MDLKELKKTKSKFSLNDLKSLYKTFILLNDKVKAIFYIILLLIGIGVTALISFLVKLIYLLII